MRLCLKHWWSAWLRWTLNEGDWNLNSQDWLKKKKKDGLLFHCHAMAHPPNTNESEKYVGDSDLHFYREILIFTVELGLWANLWSRKQRKIPPTSLYFSAGSSKYNPPFSNLDRFENFHRTSELEGLWDKVVLPIWGGYSREGCHTEMYVQKEKIVI